MGMSHSSYCYILYLLPFLINALDAIERWVNILIYLFFVPPPDKYGTRPFLKLVWTQGHSPHVPGKIPKYLWPCRPPPQRERPRGQETNNKQVNKSVVCFLASGVPSFGGADRAEGILDFAGCVWAAALCLDPLQKRPCAILIWWWDWEYIKKN